MKGISPATTSVLLGDDSKVAITKRGSISIRGCYFPAYFAPSFRISLLSVPLLDEAGLITTFSKGRALVKDKENNIILTATLTNYLYKIDEEPIDPLKKLYASSMVHATISKVRLKVPIVPQSKRVTRMQIKKYKNL